MDSHLRETLKHLSQNKKCIVAFNIQNYYQLHLLAQTAKNVQAPVIVQFSAKYIKLFEDIFGIKNLVKRFQNEFVFFHLDHCMDEEIIRFCIDSGVASVMFDGSHLSLDKNIERTNRTYNKAHHHGCLLEAELGSIAGVEDNVGTEYGAHYSTDDLKSFAAKAQYDLLALAIGNAHGVYTSTDTIRIDLLEDARGSIGDTFFVLHGGTSMPEEMIFKAIHHGVVKLNISTALKLETMNIVRLYAKRHQIYDEIKMEEIYSETLPQFFQSYILKYSI